MATTTDARAAKQALGEKREAVSSDTFARLAGEASPGLIRELVDFLVYSKKWWLTPIVVVLLLVGALIVLSASGALPFIYTLY